MLNDC